MRAGVVCPDVRSAEKLRTHEARMAEFEGLARAIDLEIVFVEGFRVREIKPATYIGGGHAADLARRVKDEEVELLLIDAALTPIQQRNLERETGAKILDRTALILEIFGARAATREGVLQVDLAHLNYQKGRLVRSWTHLERQRGGKGFLGGPGETQIESDRREIEERIALLEKRLEKVRRTRATQRKPREGAAVPLVALVGYTNAGKSSLFNRLTGSDVVAKDLLFATLDTTVRKVDLPHGRGIMLSDTVGFISDLPTDLVAAFRATLEEVTEADVILHVRDAAHPDRAAQGNDVLAVLSELGVSGEKVPIIEVWNKVDLLPISEATGLPDFSGMAPVGRTVSNIAVSAVTGRGVDDLLATIESVLSSAARTFEVLVPHSEGGKTGWLYQHGEVISRDEPDETGTRYRVRIQPRHNAAFAAAFAGHISEIGGS